MDYDEGIESYDVRDCLHLGPVAWRRMRQDDSSRYGQRGSDGRGDDVHRLDAVGHRVRHATGRGGLLSATSAAAGRALRAVSWSSGGLFCLPPAPIRAFVLPAVAAGHLSSAISSSPVIMLQHVCPIVTAPPVYPHTNFNEIEFGVRVYPGGFFVYDEEVSPSLKKVVGVILMMIGVLALVTPFTPGSWLIFVGLELLGISIWRKDRK